jgi:hypothetical protein
MILHSDLIQLKRFLDHQKTKMKAIAKHQLKRIMQSPMTKLDTSLFLSGITEPQPLNRYFLNSILNFEFRPPRNVVLIILLPSQ